MHIITDRSKLIMVSPKSLKKENELFLANRCACVTFTHVHLIVSQEDGIIQWFKIEPPDIYNEKEKEDPKLKILDEVEQEFDLGMNIGETGEKEYIAHMHYSKDFGQLIMGTHSGLFGRLEVQAENNLDEEDEEENQKNKEKKIIDQPFVQLGRFNTKRLTGLRELGETT